jgi:hypothetical protein
MFLWAAAKLELCGIFLSMRNMEARTLPSPKTPQEFAFLLCINFEREKTEVVRSRNGREHH